jgi:dTDP-4-dehydrorhamnose reductase
MIRLKRQRPTVHVVDDQHGQATWTVDVVSQIIAIVGSGAASGVYHATSSLETTWFGLTREIFDLLGADPARVRATTSSAYPRPAPWPSYSLFGHDTWAKVGLEPIGDWRQTCGYPAKSKACSAARRTARGVRDLDWMRTATSPGPIPATNSAARSGVSGTGSQ